MPFISGKTIQMQTPPCAVCYKSLLKLQIYKLYSLTCQSNVCLSLASLWTENKVVLVAGTLVCCCFCWSYFKIHLYHVATLRVTLTTWIQNPWVHRCMGLCFTVRLHTILTWISPFQSFYLLHNFRKHISLTSGKVSKVLDHFLSFFKKHGELLVWIRQFICNLF